MKDRFVVGTNEIGEIIVTDVETDRVYRYDDPSKFFGLIRLLNEQQATISALTKENKELGKNFEDLVEWVSGIAKRNVVLDEQIGQLQRENEQLRQQQQRLYNYFRDYLEDEMSAENFGEMWDNVKEDERWNDE